MQAFEKYFEFQSVKKLEIFMFADKLTQEAVIKNM